MTTHETLNTMPNAATKYQKVFEPLTIRGKSFPNRIAFPAWALKFADENGLVTDKITTFYRDLAKGGCGLIFTGAALVSEDTVAPGFEKLLRVYDDSHVEGLTNMISEIKKEGSRVGLQLAHGGRQSPGPGIGMDMVLAPSDVPIPFVQEMNPAYKLKPMTSIEIDQCITNFIEAGMRGVKAGADIIEFHAGHGYLLMQFLSPRTNIRTDEYGGSPENRARILTQIIEGFRKKAGDDVIISVRISASECIEGGIEPQDYETIIPLLEKAGVDIINISMATAMESVERFMPKKKLGEAPNVDIIKQVKDFATVPVITVGSITQLETANRLLTEKKADLIAMGRAQMSDPDIVKKSVAGQENEVRNCLLCNLCLNSFMTQPEIVCAVNPNYKA